MIHREGRRSGIDGRRLHWQAWLPEGEIRAVVVVAHGASEHGGRYSRIVERLVPDGYAVYVQDHRGHGRSEGSRALVERLDHAVEELDGFLLHAEGEHPSRPVILLGHSFGGTVALRYVTLHQDRLAALILSSPLAALEAASKVQRVAARVLSAAVPRLGLIGVDAEGISRDPDEVRAYVEDPLVHHGKLPVRTIAEIATAIDRFADAAPSITVPLLLIHGTGDRIVPIAGSEMIHERAGSADKTLLRYPGHFHELFNERAADRAKVLDDVAGWLGERF